VTMRRWNRSSRSYRRTFWTPGAGTLARNSALRSWCESKRNTSADAANGASANSPLPSLRQFTQPQTRPRKSSTPSVNQTLGRPFFSRNRCGSARSGSVIVAWPGSCWTLNAVNALDHGPTRSNLETCRARAARASDLHCPPLAEKQNRFVRQK
jgi:hypothetical protein